MSTDTGAAAAEDAFFGALLRGDGADLAAVLTTDFLMIDVLSGSEIPGDVLVGAVASGELRFHSVERIDSRIRQYGETAVITGQTRMHGSYRDQPFQAHSRYTHVYVRSAQNWQLASAQGTPITAAP